MEHQPLPPGWHRGHERRRGSGIGEPLVEQRARVPDSRKVLEGGISHIRGNGLRVDEVVDRLVEHLVPTESSAGHEIRVFIDGRERQRIAVGLGEHDVRVASPAECFRVTRHTRIELLVSRNCRFRRLTCPLRREEDGAHRGVRDVVVLDAPFIDHHTRREGFRKEEFVREESRDVGQAFDSGVATGAAEPDLEVTARGIEERRQPRLSGHTAGTTDVRIRDVQQLVRIAPAKWQDEEHGEHDAASACRH